MKKLEFLPSYNKLIQKLISCGIKKIGGRNQKIFKAYQPPQKKITKWTADITRCKYSAK